MKGMKIGLQLYTLRDVMKDDFEGTLRKAAALGFEGVEFAGYYGRPAQQVRQLLDELGLQAFGSHVGLERMQSDLQGEIDYLKALGGQYFIVPAVPVEMRSDAEAWKQLFAWLQKTGQEVASQGLTLCYHNHDFEFRSEIDGCYVLDAMYETVTPDALQVELDVCWAQFAGVDPLAYIDKYKRRTPLLHLKDFDTDADGRIITLELGNGIVELDRVIAASAEAGVRWLVVEQDNCQNLPLTSVETSMNWLKERYMQTNN